MLSARDKLSQIQVNLKAPKGQYNSFGKYKYRSCEDILEAIKPHLLGDDLKPEASLVISDEIVCVANRIYVKATATLKCGDSEISSTAYAREPESKKGMDDAQCTGATSSYARKYALNGLFCIDDTKDADTQDNTSNNAQPKPQPSNIPNEAYVIPMGKKYKGKKLAEVPKGDLINFANWLEQQPEQNPQAIDFIRRVREFTN